MATIKQYEEEKDTMLAEWKVLNVEFGEAKIAADLALASQPASRPAASPDVEQILAQISGAGLDQDTLAFVQQTLRAPAEIPVVRFEYYEMDCSIY